MFGNVPEMYRNFKQNVGHFQHNVLMCRKNTKNLPALRAKKIPLLLPEFSSYTFSNSSFCNNL